MYDTKALVAGALLSALAALFQIIPVIFSEAFIFMTILSAFPIYISARMHSRIGCISYTAATILIMLLSTHEGMFFMLTNGPVGLCLGICCKHIKNRTLGYLISGSLLSFTICILIYLLGIPVFIVPVPGILPVQLCIVILFSTIYCAVYSFAANFLFAFINRHYMFTDEQI